MSVTAIMPKNMAALKFPIMWLLADSIVKVNPIEDGRKDDAALHNVVGDDGVVVLVLFIFDRTVTSLSLTHDWPWIWSLDVSDCAACECKRGSATVTRELKPKAAGPGTCIEVWPM